MNVFKKMSNAFDENLTDNDVTKLAAVSTASIVMWFVVGFVIGRKTKR